MTHRDRPRGPSGRREAAGDAAHRQGLPTPSDGSRGRPQRRAGALGDRQLTMGHELGDAPNRPVFGKPGNKLVNRHIFLE